MPYLPILAGAGIGRSADAVPRIGNAHQLHGLIHVSVHARQNRHGFHARQRPQFLRATGRHAHKNGIHKDLDRAGDRDMTAREFAFQAALRGRDRLHVPPGRGGLEFGARMDAG